jgi:hypothetical protein
MDEIISMTMADYDMITANMLSSRIDRYQFSTLQERPCSVRVLKIDKSSFAKE